MSLLKGKGNVDASAIIIVASGFIINITYGGISNMSGLYLDSFLETYNAGKTVTTWVISIQGSFTYFFGIIAGSLVGRYGTRLVAVAGALMSTCGFLLSAFSPNVEFLYLSFGIMSGVGFCFLQVPNSIAVQQHTSERRALAAGIVLTGAGFGEFIMPLIIKRTMITYAWRGSLILLSGILLHTLPCALLLRPPPLCRKLEDKKYQELGPITEGKTVIASSHDRINIMESDTFTKSDESHLSKSRLRPNDSVTLKHSLQQEATDVDLTLSYPATYGSTFSIKKLIHIEKFEKGTKYGKLNNLKSFWNGVKDHFAWSVDGGEPLLTPVIFLCTASGFFQFAGLPVIYVFMAETAFSMGYGNSSGAMLMSFTGIGEISGRIAGTILGTMHDRLPMIIYASMIMIAGACTAAISFCSTYNHILIASIGYGISAGMAISIKTTALRVLVGINHLPRAVGIAYTFGGIGNLLTIQTLAYAWEQTGSFFLPYLIGGIMLVMSGICLIGASVMSDKKVSRNHQ